MDARAANDPRARVNLMSVEKVIRGAGCGSRKQRLSFYVTHSVVRERAIQTLNGQTQKQQGSATHQAKRWTVQAALAEWVSDQDIL